MLSEGVVGTVAVLLLLLLAGFLIRARVKLRALEDEARRRGLVVHLPFTTDPSGPLDALAVELDIQHRGSNGLWRPRWGVGVTGPFEGRELLLADHEVPDSSASSTLTVRHSMLVRPLPPAPATRSSWATCCSTRPRRCAGFAERPGARSQASRSTARWACAEALRQTIATGVGSRPMLTGRIDVAWPLCSAAECAQQVSSSVLATTDRL